MLFSSSKKARLWLFIDLEFSDIADLAAFFQNLSSEYLIRGAGGEIPVII